jgi:hypothetical protein
MATASGGSPGASTQFPLCRIEECQLAISAEERVGGVSVEVLQHQGRSDDQLRPSRCLITTNVIYGNFLVNSLPHVQGSKAKIVDPLNQMWFDIQFPGTTEALLFQRACKDALMINRLIENRREQDALKHKYDMSEKENQQLKDTVARLEQQLVESKEREVPWEKTPPASPDPSCRQVPIELAKLQQIEASIGKLKQLHKENIEMLKQKHVQDLEKSAKQKAQALEEADLHKCSMLQIEVKMNELIGLHAEGSGLRKQLEAQVGSLKKNELEVVELKAVVAKHESNMVKIDSATKLLIELHAESSRLKKQQVEELENGKNELEKAAATAELVVDLSRKRLDLQKVLNA